MKIGTINLETKIMSSAEVCFDLSRSVDLHVDSVHETSERAIEGVTSGLMKLDDVVTWEAFHFGIKQRLKVKLSKFDRPNYFQDKQVDGIFKSFTHDHYFTEDGNTTLMRDVFQFQCPFGIVGRIADPLIRRHLRKFLNIRNQFIKTIAEGDDWSKYIS